jgi:hypothetical protein
MGQPEVIAYKEEILEGEKRRSRPERVALDLADAQAKGVPGNYPWTGACLLHKRMSG